MTGYGDHLRAAQDAIRTAHGLSRRLADQLRRRDRALAAAWDDRPGEETWEDLVSKVNRGVPREARISVSTARAAERAYRRPGGDAAAVLGGPERLRDLMGDDAPVAEARARADLAGDEP